jgi:hypothetical protein
MTNEEAAKTMIKYENTFDLGIRKRAVPNHLQENEMIVYMIVDANGNPVEGWAESLCGGGSDSDTPSSEEITWLRAGGHLWEPRTDDHLVDGSIPPEGCLVSGYPPDCEEEWVAIHAEYMVSLYTTEDVARVESMVDQGDEWYPYEPTDIGVEPERPSLTDQAEEIFNEAYDPFDPTWPSRESGVRNAVRVVVALDLYSSRIPVNDDEYNGLVGQILDELSKIDITPLDAACTALQDYSTAHGMSMITCPKCTGSIPNFYEDCCPYCVGKAAAH